MNRLILLCVMISVLLLGQNVFAQQPCEECPEGAQCLLPECPAEETETVIPETAFIRVWNRSDVDFENVRLQILEQTEEFPLIEAGTATDYIPFEVAYRYGWIEFVADGESESMIPIDYVGETPLEPGFYTYAVDVQDGTLSFAFLEAVATVEYVGGFCVDNICQRTVTIYNDGTVSTLNGAGEHTVETVNEELITALTEAIVAADFEEIRSHPFTDTCPVAYDGQELIFTFYTDESAERISTCVYDFDERSELYQAVIAIVEKPFDEA